MLDSGAAKVFISHTTRDRRDHVLAVKLAEGLKARGVQVWIAPHSIPPGDRWEQSLVAAVLDECSHFLVILSEASVGSEWVQRELGLAQDRCDSGRPLKILALRVGKIGEHPHSEFLRAYQELAYSENFATQLRAVAAALSLPPAVPALFKSLIESTTRHFVGRERVFAKVQKFLSDKPKGCFFITGDPGQGKTAIMAEFVKRTGCPAHFNTTNGGINRPEQFFDSICQQFSARYDVAATSPTGETPALSLRIAELLLNAADARPAGEPFILAIDALDEVAPDSGGDLTNVLHLPQTLPDGVFLLLSSRRKDLQFVTRDSQGEFDLKTDASSRGDIERFLTMQLSDAAFAPWLERRHWNLEQGVAQLAERSENNFMYLHFVLSEIGGGGYAEASDPLPRGLRDYYMDHWRRMGMVRNSPGTDLKLRVLQVLALIRGPVSVRLLADFVKASVPEVRRVIEEWGEFLHTVSEEGETRHRLYHASFREFLETRDAIVDGFPEFKRAIAAHYMGVLRS